MFFRLFFLLSGFLRTNGKENTVSNYSWATVTSLDVYNNTIQTVITRCFPPNFLKFASHEKRASFCIFS